MNPHLELLLSKVYDGALASEHLVDLRKSALTDAMIAEQFIRSVPPSLIGNLLGFDMRGITSAMLLPFRAPGGGFMNHVRFKVFPPLTDADGRRVKYLQPKGSGPRLYLVARCLAEVLGGDAPLWLVEGEKKALYAAQLGLPSVGFTGIQGWHVRGSRDLLDDFDRLPLAGRVVELVPDGDAATNPDVARGAADFGEALTRRGAQVRLVMLPVAA